MFKWLTLHIPFIRICDRSVDKQVSIVLSLLEALLQALCGIGEGQSYVHFMFVYKDPLGEAEYDDNISLSYKLPVLQEGDG